MKLKEVLLHRPGVEIHYMKDEPEKFSWKEKPELKKLQKEYDSFAEVLREEGIKINYLVKSLPSKPNLMFIRDCAFVLNKKALILRLASKHRQGEEILVKEKLFRLGFRIAGQLIYPAILEGSSIFLLDEKSALIGIDGRANLDGVEKFKKTFEMDVFYLKGDLSKVLNFAENLAILSERMVDSRVYEFLKEKEYEIILASKEDEEVHGIEFLQIDSSKIVNVKCELNRKLRMNGFDVIELEVEELLKGFAGVKGLVLPLDYKI